MRTMKQTRERLARWVSLLTVTRSPRLTLKAMRAHASGPILEASRKGARIGYADKAYTLKQNNKIIQLPGNESALLSALLISDLIDAGWELTWHGEGPGSLKIPDGPNFVLHPDSLPSDLAVLRERFLDAEYGRLNVCNSIVIDIGANIGDSAIYFALRGAKKVFAFEPFQETYLRARENIAANHLDGRIELFCIGLGEEDEARFAVYDPANSWTLTTVDVPGQVHPLSGQVYEQVRLLSFASLVARCAPGVNDRVICKMDCEGAEFDALCGSSPQLDALRAIDEMLIEYHGEDVTSITDTLASSGFRIHVEEISSRMGLIWASREAKCLNDTGESRTAGEA